ncbi:phage portal protein [Salinicola sp. V024]|uniref:phage portal protein n=1 Tax=Salinicola sp. V024 TaxID=3459609 RepID=UPI004044F4C4
MKFFGKMFSSNDETKSDTTTEKTLQHVSSNESVASGWWSRIQEPFLGAFERNQDISRKDALSFYAVSACITHISDDISKLNVNLMQRNSSDILQKTTNPAFSPVLRKPNRYQSMKQFLQAWLISKLKTGNAYIIKIRDARGVVTEMHVIDPDRVQVLIDNESGEIFYKISGESQSLDTVSNSGITIAQRDMIHDRMNTIFHPLIGTSPLYACAAGTNAGTAMLNNSAAFFKNMSRPASVISGDKAIPAQHAKALAEGVKASHGGGNLGSVMVLGDGLTYTPITTISANDSQLVQQLQLSEKQVCAVFHVPHDIISSDTNSTYSNIQTRYQQYYQQALQSHIIDIENALEEGLGIGEGSATGYEIKFDLNDLMKMDSATLVNFLKESVGAGIMTPNEARQRLSLTPIEGGNSVYLQQQNYSLQALARRDNSDDPFNTKKTSVANAKIGNATIGSDDAEGEE